MSDFCNLSPSFDVETTMNTKWEYRDFSEDGFTEWRPLTPGVIGADDVLEDGSIIRNGKKTGWIAEQADGNGLFRKVQARETSHE